MRWLRTRLAEALEWSAIRVAPDDIRAIYLEVARLGKDAYRESKLAPALQVKLGKHSS